MGNKWKAAMAYLNKAAGSLMKRGCPTMSDPSSDKIKHAERVCAAGWMCVYKVILWL